MLDSTLSQKTMPDGEPFLNIYEERQVALVITLMLLDKDSD